MSEEEPEEVQDSPDETKPPVGRKRRSRQNKSHTPLTLEQIRVDGDSTAGLFKMNSGMFIVENSNGIPTITFRKPDEAIERDFAIEPGLIDSADPQRVSVGKILVTALKEHIAMLNRDVYDISLVASDDSEEEDPAPTGESPSEETPESDTDTE